MTRTLPPPDKPPPPPPGSTWPKDACLLPGAPGPNQRWPGSGYQPGSGLRPRQLTPEQVIELRRGWELFTARTSGVQLIFVPRRPRPGLALSVVGAIQRAKHRLCRVKGSGANLVELAIGLALVYCAFALLFAVFP